MRVRGARKRYDFSMKIVVHRHIRNLAKASTIVLYEAIPVWSGLSKYIFVKTI